MDFMVFSDDACRDCVDHLVQLVCRNSYSTLTLISTGKGWMPNERVDAVIGPDELRVRDEELASTLDSDLPLSRLVQIGRRCSGAIESITAEVARQEGLVSEFQDSKVRCWMDRQSFYQSAEFLDILIRRKRWISAFEIAVTHHPRYLKHVVDGAGRELMDSGEYDFLWSLLSNVGEEHLKSDAVMYWYYAAALARGCHPNAADRVRRYLQEAEAPRLRGLFSVACPTKKSVEQALRACEAQRDSYTLKYLAFALLAEGQAARSLEMLREAMFLAMEEDDAVQVVDIAAKIAEALLRTGEYLGASTWASWAYEQCLSRNIKEEIRVLEVLGTVVFSSIVANEAVEVAPLVERLMNSAPNLQVPSLIAMYSTIGDYWFISGDLDQAEHFYSCNTHGQLGSIVDAYAVRDRVRLLISRGEVRAATELARRCHSATRSASRFETAVGDLVMGMVLIHSSPISAEHHLRAALRTVTANRQGTLAAQAAIHLASCLSSTGRKTEAERVLLDSAWALQELSPAGWHLFGSGAPKTYLMWTKLQASRIRFQFRFLGGVSLVSDGESKSIPIRWAEILVVLAMHPSGLSGAELSLHVLGDRSSSSSLKSTISRLRKIVPISSRPYRLAAPFTADFADVEAALTSGRVEDALVQYRGPLLQRSQAPFIADLRESLESTLQQAALQGGTTGDAIDLGSYLVDDLSYWERILASTPGDDPRRASVLAKVEQLRTDWWNGSTVDEGT